LGIGGGGNKSGSCDADVKSPLDDPARVRHAQPVPTSTGILGRIAAGLAAALLGSACASSGPQHEADQVFAKSLRDADPTKKANATKADKSKAPTASEFKLPGRRVYLELDNSGKKLGLVNRSAADPSEIYGRQTGKDDVFLKVGTDDLMADLCEALRRLEFAKYAETQSPADAAQWSLTMNIDGDKKTVYYVRGREPERLRRLTNIQATFLHGYNRVYGLRAMEQDDGGKALFEQEKMKLKSQNQETIKKASEKP
jgi:hypothetical protein